jgi:hypothetical protein
MRFALTLCDEEPPIPLANIEVYRTTIPDKFYQIPQEEDTWIGHKKDEQVFRRNANGSPLSWTGETRFERVLTTGTWKQGRFDWVMVRPGNPARFQAGRYSRRTPDTSVEVWNAYSELQKLEDIVEYDKVRAPRYAHARANRTLPREPYQDPLVPLLCVSEPDGSASGCVTDASMPSMHSCGSESGEQSEGADPSIDFCDLCNKPAWFQKYKMDKKANKCKSMFCGFVRNKRKYPWYRDVIPCMLTKDQQLAEKAKQLAEKANRNASDEESIECEAYSDDDHPYLSQDMPDQEHIEREHGIDSYQRVKSFQRMMYGLVAKDIPRKLWGTVEGAQAAVDK